MGLLSVVAGLKENPHRSPDNRQWKIGACCISPLTSSTNQMVMIQLGLKFGEEGGVRMQPDRFRWTQQALTLGKQVDVSLLFKRATKSFQGAGVHSSTALKPARFDINQPQMLSVAPVLHTSKCLRWERYGGKEHLSPKQRYCVAVAALTCPSPSPCKHPHRCFHPLCLIRPPLWVYITGFHSRHFDSVEKAQVLQITLMVALLYSNVTVSHDSVTLNQHAQH